MNPIMISKIASRKISLFKQHIVLVAAMMVMAAFAFSSTSCATSRGFGRDVKKVGNKIERAADRTGGAN